MQVHTQNLNDLVAKVVDELAWCRSCRTWACPR
jgi:hypothetical protein